mmetsp:Transcript_16241/g.25217  ORF Transcript_16241/g.25217 Transcript_16241/m.25217 type:complete len:196 (-) Transcript_16241:24-611(-)
MRSVPGPVRLYSSNKYNKDLLPTGSVSQETQARLAPLLQKDDESAFFSVTVQGDSTLSQGPDYRDNKDMDQGPDSFSKAQASLLTDPGPLTEPKTKKNMYKGVDLDAMPLPDGVSIEQAKKWLDEADLVLPDSKDKKKKRDTDEEYEEPAVDLDSVGSSAARMQAEHELDQAILHNDEEGIQAAIDKMKSIDEGQ